MNNWTLRQFKKGFALQSFLSLTSYCTLSFLFVVQCSTGFTKENFKLFRLRYKFKCLSLTLNHKKLINVERFSQEINYKLKIAHKTVDKVTNIRKATAILHKVQIQMQQCILCMNRTETMSFIYLSMIAG